MRAVSAGLDGTGPATRPSVSAASRASVPAADDAAIGPRSTPSVASESEAIAASGARRRPLPGSRPAARAAAGQVTREVGRLVIPADVQGEGSLQAASVRLCGTWIGDVHCDPGPVFIDVGAMLMGQVVCEGDVHVAGTVQRRGRGEAVRAAGGLRLAPTADVRGDVASTWLQVWPGARLAGVARSVDPSCDGAGSPGAVASPPMAIPPPCERSNEPKPEGGGLPPSAPAQPAG